MSIQDEKTRKVAFAISAINSMIIIKTENPYCGSGASSKKTRTLSESDKGHIHGYGLQIINTLSKKYDGTLATEMKDGIYSATVMLSNNN